MNRHESIAHHSMRIGHRMIADYLFKARSKHRPIHLLFQINMRHLAVSLEVVRLAGFDLVKDVYGVVNVAFLEG